MAWKNHESHYHQVARNTLLLLRHGWRKFWNSPSSHGWNYTCICQLWLEIFLKFTILKLAETALAFVNHDWRKFWSSASSNGWNFTSIRQLWFEKISKFTIFKRLKLHFYLSTMVVKKNWNSLSSNGWNCTSIRPSWLEKSLKFAIFKWLKLQFYLSNLVGESIKIHFSQMSETSVKGISKTWFLFWRHKTPEMMTWFFYLCIHVLQAFVQLSAICDHTESNELCH